MGLIMILYDTKDLAAGARECASTGAQESVCQHHTFSFCLEVNALVDMHGRLPPFGFHAQTHGRIDPKKTTNPNPTSTIRRGEKLGCCACVR